MKYFEKVAGVSQIVETLVPFAMGYGGYKSKQKGEGAGKGHARSALYSSTAGGIYGSTLGYKNVKSQLKSRGILNDPQLARLFKGKAGRAIVGGAGALTFGLGSPIYHGIGRLLAREPKGK